jgi:hypothetical protein
LNASCSDARRRQFVEILSRRIPIGSRGGPGADLFGADLTNIIYNQATR